MHAGNRDASRVRIMCPCRDRSKRWGARVTGLVARQLLDALEDRVLARVVRVVLAGDLE